ncbi:unnamed protein product [Clonostachys byssicola]|uniref:Disintegrin and metalloproteinase domain-containing protein B n=1 Tax=Clonostachys byssicola TaxID=160290 RepID=A0A9N9UQX6_9HYPO|nr:unnamed protein product [Clonostachys byssicola]
MDGDGLVCTFSALADGIQDGGDRSSSGSRHLVWCRPSSFNRDVAVEVAARGEPMMYSSHVLRICLLAVALIANAYALSLKRSIPSDLFYLEDLVFSSPPGSDRAAKELDVSFTLPGDYQGTIRLSLHRNDGIYHQPVSVNYVRADGTSHSFEEIARGSHLAFQGTAHVRDNRGNGHHDIQRKAGWARMSFYIKDGVQLGEGSFTVDDVKYHVQTDYNYRSTWFPGEPEAPESEKPYMVVWRDSFPSQDGSAQDLEKRASDNESGCAFDSLDFNHPEFASTRELDDGMGSLDERQFSSGGLDNLDLTSVIGSTSGCPSTRLIALIGIATDCSYTSQFSSNDDLRQHVLSQINTASQLYEDSFNISLRVRNLTISERDCPSTTSTSTPWNVQCSSTTSIGDRLQSFSTWRSQSSDGVNAVWTLLTSCNSASTVGIAWMGTVCNDSARRRSTPSANVVVRTPAEWQVIAHEIGHNFGAVHDCTTGCSGSTANGGDRCCPFSQSSCDATGQYIMNPTSSRAMSVFSPCTIGTICTAIGRNLIQTSCLRGNDDVPTISEGVCGNGIVETGEECDCGGEQGCQGNSCCNPTTCRFTSGSVCDPSNDKCCTDQCALASQGTVCRTSSGECDPEETCDGSSASCPEDTHADDGASCGNDADGTTCASGQCTSRNWQCGIALFNSTSSNAQACSSNSCELDCFGSGNTGTCNSTGMYFLDGTSCGSGRFCYSGDCSRSRGGGGSSGGSGGNSAMDWINNNRTLFIVICTVGGVLVIIAFVACCWCMCRRSRKPTSAPVRAPPMSSNSRGSALVNRAVNQPPPVYQTSLYNQGQRYA